MHGGKATGGVIDFLSESSRLLVCIDFFDVARASSSAPDKVAKITSAAIGQAFPMFELTFVLCARCHRRSGYHTNLRLTQPPLQQSAGSVFLVSEETALADDLGDLRRDHLVPGFVAAGDTLEDVS
jgi:hypothetical protein